MSFINNVDNNYLDVDVDHLMTYLAGVAHHVPAPPLHDLLDEVLLGAVQHQVVAGVPLAAAQLAGARVLVTSDWSLRDE